jgi:four helix bundle protein
MKYDKFEDVPVWQESQQIVSKVYYLLRENKNLQRDFSLCDQLKRSAYSIMLNIAEGFERSSNKEFANFLNIAKGSAGEVRCILHIMKDNKYIANSEYEVLYKNIEDISKHLSNFRKFLIKNSQYKK